ncbi:hypothetical protein QTP88_022271 [Uroleucon formosanum]
MLMLFSCDNLLCCSELLIFTLQEYNYNLQVSSGEDVQGLGILLHLSVNQSSSLIRAIKIMVDVLSSRNIDVTNLF